MTDCDKVYIFMYFYKDSKTSFRIVKHFVLEFKMLMKFYKINKKMFATSSTKKTLTAVTYLFDSI